MYDVVHYNYHHGPEPTWEYFKKMKAAHMRHHFRNNSKEFGVTTKFWDTIFGTI